MGSQELSFTQHTHKHTHTQTPWLSLILCSRCCWSNQRMRERLCGELNSWHWFQCLRVTGASSTPEIATYSTIAIRKKRMFSSGLGPSVAWTSRLWLLSRLESWTIYLEDFPYNTGRLRDMNRTSSSLSILTVSPSCWEELRLDSGRRKPMKNQQTCSVSREGRDLCSLRFPWLGHP